MSDEQKAYDVLMRLLFYRNPLSEIRPYIIHVVSPTLRDSATAFAAARTLAEKNTFVRSRLIVNNCKREIRLSDGSGVARWVVLPSDDGRAAQYLVEDNVLCE